MLLSSNKMNLGFKAQDFRLMSVDDRYYSLSNTRGVNGMVIAFICNHCPYVIDLISRMVLDFNYLMSKNIGIVAIMSNDVISYPADSFENMKKFANNHNFEFPYLFDSEQKVALKYKAICTPDFYCFDKRDKLFYRGRLDNVKYKTKYDYREKSLVSAFNEMLKNNKIEKNQFNSMGCSIKWKKA